MKLIFIVKSWKRFRLSKKFWLDTYLLYSIRKLFMLPLIILNFLCNNLIKRKLFENILLLRSIAVAILVKIFFLWFTLLEIWRVLFPLWGPGENWPHWVRMTLSFFVFAEAVWIFISNEICLTWNWFRASRLLDDLSDQNASDN